MSIKDIEQKELTASQRAVLAADIERKAKLGTGSQLDEWLEFGPGLLIRSDLAKKIAHVSKRQGRGYVEAYNQIMVEHGLYREGVNDPEEIKAEKRMRATYTAVLWLHEQSDRLQILRELRNKMSPVKRALVNSPITARQRVEKEIARRQAAKDGVVEESTATEKVSKLAELKRKNVELEREIAALRAKLARADGGSLFDLQHSTHDEIAAVLTAHWTARRWRDFRAKADAAFKAKEQKPAG